jgi:hypothetical protein
MTAKFQFPGVDEDDRPLNAEDAANGIVAACLVACVLGLVYLVLKGALGHTIGVVGVVGVVAVMSITIKRLIK